jgi:hypothetical protein
MVLVNGGCKIMHVTSILMAYDHKNLMTVLIGSSIVDVIYTCSCAYIFQSSVEELKQ